MKHMMEFTAEMIAGFLGGDIVGNKDAKVHTVSSIEEGRAGSLAYLTNPKYEPYGNAKLKFSEFFFEDIE